MNKTELQLLIKESIVEVIKENEEHLNSNEIKLSNGVIVEFTIQKNQIITNVYFGMSNEAEFTEEDMNQLFNSYKKFINNK